MPLCASAGVGQYAASEGHQLIWSTRYVNAQAGRAALWFHSAGGTYLQQWIESNNTFPLLRMVCGNLNMPMIAADTGGTAHWGNDTAQARASDMRTYVGTRLGAVTSKVVLFGVSMGGILALNWARANPTLVQAIVLFYPAVDLQSVHDSPGGAAPTEAAYGGSLAAFNAAVDSHNPATHASDYAGVPIKMYYSTSDAIIDPATQAAFAANVGGSAFEAYSLGGVAHADMTKIPLGDLATFLREHA